MKGLWWRGAKGNSKMIHAVTTSEPKNVERGSTSMVARALASTADVLWTVGAHRGRSSSDDMRGRNEHAHDRQR